jgi:cytochrome P450
MVFMNTTAEMIRLTSFDDVNEVLRRSADFVQGGHWQADLFIENTLVQLNGQVHLERRRLESPLFRKEAMAHYETTVLAAAIEREFACIRAETEPGQPMGADLTKTARRCLTPVSSALVGIDGVRERQSIERMRWYLEVFAAIAHVEQTSEESEPIIERARGAKAEFIDEYYAPSLARRMDLVRNVRAGHESESKLPVDLLTMLLTHGAGQIDPDTVLRECLIFLVGNTETTTSATVATMQRLFEWLERHPEERPLASQDPDFVRSASNEALRLSPPSPSLFRLVPKTVELQSGRVIEGGQRIALDLAQANRDQSVFGKDAAEFNPHRETPSRVRPFGLAFGAGPHMCIGRPFATTYPKPGESGIQVGTLIRLVQALFAAGARPSADATVGLGEGGFARGEYIIEFPTHS